jgi:hypothetical protein
MLQKSRADLEFWASSARNKALFLQQEINSGASQNAERTQEVVEAMEEKACAIKKFLMDFPEHTDSLHPLEVTKLLETHGMRRDYGALKTYVTKPTALQTEPNPFRPTHEELKQNPEWVHSVGCSGVRGYPTKPGEKVQDGFLVMASSAFKPSGIPKRKEPFEPVLEAMEEAKRIRTDSPRRNANSALVDLLSSSQDSETTQPDPSNVLAESEEEEEVLMICESPEQAQSRQARYNLRPRK